jgi:hypothetical protein
MVSWQTFVRLGFEVAENKGAQFSGIEQGGDFIEGLSQVWNADKERLKQMTERQAQNYLDDKVTA